MKNKELVLPGIIILGIIIFGIGGIFSTSKNWGDPVAFAGFLLVFCATIVMIWQRKKQIDEKRKGSKEKDLGL